MSVRKIVLYLNVFHKLKQATIETAISVSMYVAKVPKRHVEKTHVLPAFNAEHFKLNRFNKLMLTQTMLCYMLKNSVQINVNITSYRQRIFFKYTIAKCKNCDTCGNGYQYKNLRSNQNLPNNSLLYLCSKFPLTKSTTLVCKRLDSQKGKFLIYSLLQFLSFLQIHFPFDMKRKWLENCVYRKRISTLSLLWSIVDKEQGEFFSWLMCF
jgi:hypothetical protein